MRGIRRPLCPKSTLNTQHSTLNTTLTSHVKVFGFSSLGFGITNPISFVWLVRSPHPFSSLVGWFFFFIISRGGFEIS